MTKKRTPIVRTKSPLKWTLFLLGVCILLVTLSAAIQRNPTLNTHQEVNLTSPSQAIGIPTLEPPETIILKQFSDGTKISLTTNLALGTNIARQLYLIPQGRDKSAIHLKDFGICTDPRVITSSEEFEQAIIDAGGCGDGQDYYLISLNNHSIQRISLPYNYIDSIHSEPIRFLSKSILLFKQVTIVKNGNKYESQNEYYTADLNQLGVYQKSDQR